MKVWIHILIFVVSSLTVFAQTCPSEHFSAVFLASIDQTVDPSNFIPDDPGLNFFKEVMKFDEDEINNAFEYAAHFFNESFGLDFSTSPPNDQNEFFFENAKMGPYISPEKAEYLVTANNWIRNGNTRSRCYKVRTGGMRVTFSGDQTLYGSYGGDNGKPAEMGDALSAGIFRIDVCKQSPVIILYRSATPVRSEPVDGNFVGTFDTNNEVLGRGKAHLIINRIPDNNVADRFRITFRFLFTF